jgi:hypothetical protein
MDNAAAVSRCQPASYRPGAPELHRRCFASNLPVNTATASGAALPVNLAGVSVSIRDNSGATTAACCSVRPAD